MSKTRLRILQKELKIPVSKLKSKDMRAMPIAMYRAMLRAHEIARQTGTGVVIRRDGVLQTVEPMPQDEIERKRTLLREYGALLLGRRLTRSGCGVPLPQPLFPQGRRDQPRCSKKLGLIYIT